MLQNPKENILGDWSDCLEVLSKSELLSVEEEEEMFSWTETKIHITNPCQFLCFNRSRRSSRSAMQYRLVCFSSTYQKKPLTYLHAVFWGHQQAKGEQRKRSLNWTTNAYLMEWHGDGWRLVQSESLLAPVSHEKRRRRSVCGSSGGTRSKKGKILICNLQDVWCRYYSVTLLPSTITTSINCARAIH